MCRQFEYFNDTVFLTSVYLSFLFFESGACFDTIFYDLYQLQSIK